MNDRDRFDKFTERARRVLSLAQEEAQRFNHSYIGTEHLLLGLVREGDGVAAKVLSNLGVELNRVRNAVEFIIGRGDRIVLGEIGLTPRSKKVMELAVDEARRFNHHYIGTEHILLGLLREGEGIAAGVLRSLGINLEQVRAQTIQVLNATGEVHSGGLRFERSAAAMTPTSATPGQAPASEAAGREPGGVKSNVVTCRLDDAAVDALDALVEAGVRSTRSDAAAWLIGAGIESHRALFARVNATVSEIRRLRSEAQKLADDAIAEAERAAQTPTSPKPPETPTPPADSSQNAESAGDENEESHSKGPDDEAAGGDGTPA